MAENYVVVPWDVLQDINFLSFLAPHLFEKLLRRGIIDTTSCARVTDKVETHRSRFSCTNTAGFPWFEHLEATSNLPTAGLQLEPPMFVLTVRS